jgi:hypothetical protein
MDAGDTTVEVLERGERLGIGGVVAQEFAVAFGGAAAVVLQGDRGKLLALLDSAAAELRRTEPTMVPRLAVCSPCGVPIAWDPAQQRYVDLSNPVSDCDNHDDHAPDAEATEEAEAAHVNAWHVREPETSTCPWCVIDVAVAGDPSVTYRTGHGDPTAVPAHLRRLVPELVADGVTDTCGARNDVHRCSWTDPIHTERAGVPHVAGTGTSVTDVWPTDPGVPGSEVRRAPIGDEPAVLRTARAWAGL